jgi:hypothetical protein
MSIIISFGIGCKHGIDYTQYPEIKYSTDVAPIIIANCTQDGCHGSTNSESFKLLTYDDLILHGEVKSGKPEKSKLYSVIKSLNNDIRMPVPPLAPLTDEQIKIIYLWIGQGAKNN